MPSEAGQMYRRSGDKVVKTLSLDESYGCNLREREIGDRGLYFRGQRAKEFLERELKQFVAKLEERQ